MRDLIAAAAAAFALSTTAALAQTEQTGEAEAAQDQALAGEMDFATAAAQNSYAELMLSGLALQKTDDRAVRHFSGMMLEHHAPAIRNLMQRIDDTDIMVPVMPNEEQMAAIERLQGLSDEEFTLAYMEHQVMAHEMAVAVFEQGAESAQTEDLQAYAMHMLPIMRAHLEVAQHIAQDGGQ